MIEKINICRIEIIQDKLRFTCMSTEDKFPNIKHYEQEECRFFKEEDNNCKYNIMFTCMSPKARKEALSKLIIALQEIDWY